MIVNGKEYSLWSQFVEGKKEWIGGILEELQDSMPILSSEGCPQTKITNVRLEPNGKESAFFSVDGKEYGCGADVSVLGIIGGEEGWITLSGYGGHKWRIKKKTNK